MDSEMIERVIKASFDCWKEHREDKSHFTIDDMSEEEREFARRHAIAIIKAMREPTDKMIEAAIENFDEDYIEDIQLIWRDMIDAITGD